MSYFSWWFNFRVQFCDRIILVRRIAIRKYNIGLVGHTDTDSRRQMPGFLDLWGHSIVSTTTFYCSKFGSVLACRTLCWGGFSHSWRIGGNKSPSMFSYPANSCFCLVFRRVLYWGHCCTFCTLLSLNSWSCVIVCTSTDDSQVYVRVPVSEVRSS